MKKNTLTQLGREINKAFTLIEILVGILIVSIVMVGGFQALSAVTIGKVRLIQKTDIQKESFYFTQKLFEMIKKGGTIDYEEYFNRKVIGNTTYSSGHFDILSGFGNYGEGGALGTQLYGGGFYYCISGDVIGEKIGTDGCYNTDFNSFGTNVLWEQQRYGQYSLQFVDYNSNYDGDNGTLGDENGDGSIMGDDDDEYLGDGPAVFSNGVDLTELYLLSGDKKTRTIFRWNIKKDKDSPYACGFIDNISNTLTGTGKLGCIGTIEYLKLDGRDWGMNHSLTIPPIDNTRYDGLIDTWVIDKDLTSNVNDIAGSNTITWLPLFPETINVSEFEVYAYPNKNVGFAWNNNSSSVNISPYIILKFKLMPSWISRKKIHGEGQELDFSMTINLSDIYSQ